MLKFNQLDFIENEVKEIPGFKNQKPKAGSALKYFFLTTGRAIRLFSIEREIFLFSFLQCIAIALGYYLWVQILAWIPEEVWRSTENSNSGSIADIVLLVWSLIIIGIIALPVGLLSACIGAVYFLRHQGRKSTIAACWALVFPKAKPIWIFFWIDGWITISQILDRLPSKEDLTSPRTRAINEAVYFAWKLGTIGILPALITGRGLVESGKESISLVKHRLADTALLRVGYSLVCWIVGIAAYIGTLILFLVFPHILPEKEIYSIIFHIYFWAGIPILIAVAIIQIFIRPIYILAASNMYADYLDERKEQLMLPPSPSNITNISVAFLVLWIILVVVLLFRNELGITTMLSTPYGP